MNVNQKVQKNYCTEIKIMRLLISTISMILSSSISGACFLLRPVFQNMVEVGVIQFLGIGEQYYIYMKLYKILIDAFLIAQ
jgi:hypothetical protein